MPELTKYTCPKCGARLAVARADHHLTGQEWLRCLVHGNIRHLRETTSRGVDDDMDEVTEDG